MQSPWRSVMNSPFSIVRGWHTLKRQSNLTELYCNNSRAEIPRASVYACTVAYALTAIVACLTPVDPRRRRRRPVVRLAQGQFDVVGDCKSARRLVEHRERFSLSSLLASSFSSTRADIKIHGSGSLSRRARSTVSMPVSLGMCMSSNSRCTSVVLQDPQCFLTVGGQGQADNRTAQASRGPYRGTTGRRR